MPESIKLRGCRQHNLRGVDVSILRGGICVITGVSGSGKSSLAFDTLYAEGQRRFLESLSQPARQWIKQLPKPDLDFAEGLSPTLAVSQGRARMAPNATVATHTDLHDFLALLLTHCGSQYSPSSGKELKRHTRQEIVEKLLQFPDGTRLQLLAPVNLRGEPLNAELERLQSLGYVRFRIDGTDWEAGEAVPNGSILEIIIDRIVVKAGVRERLTQSIDTALDVGGGQLTALEGRNGPIHPFSEIYVCPETGDGFAPLTTKSFSRHSIHGACPVCTGQQGRYTVDREDLSSAVLEEGAVLTVLSRLSSAHKRVWLEIWEGIGEQLDSNQIVDGTDQEIILSRSKDRVATRWKGLASIMEDELAQKGARSRLLDFPSVTWTPCIECEGTGLKAQTRSCRIDGYSIVSICNLSVDNALQVITDWKFTGQRGVIAQELLPDIKSRLQFLQEAGLGYIELSRSGRTLSDGEVQRVQLAAQIGTQLSGIIYVLDEPSLGLHYQDIKPLIQAIQRLRDLGNTIVLVEHEQSLIEQADQVIELGPGAGASGGQITFSGNIADLKNAQHTATGAWLSGSWKPPVYSSQGSGSDRLRVGPVSCHNLKDICVDIPMNRFVGICGVSGSGKSTLAIDVIAESLEQARRNRAAPDNISGIEHFDRLVVIRQGEAGAISRSFPATYVGVMTPLRNMYSQTRSARARGYTASRFSLNRRGGRCDACDGIGEIRVSMPFLPDIFVSCEVCDGRRFNFETLQVQWEGFSIADVLEMSVAQAHEVFRKIPEVARPLRLMQELGLDYMPLGQPFHTLSGGEKQRLRLVADLSKYSAQSTLYILDEPCAGLHAQDVNKLTQILHKLVDHGNSVLIVEHNLGLLQQTDWLIELGPVGGPSGGKIIYEGEPCGLTDTPTGSAFTK